MYSALEKLISSVRQRNKSHLSEIQTKINKSFNFRRTYAKYRNIADNRPTNFERVQYALPTWTTQVAKIPRLTLTDNLEPV